MNRQEYTILFGEPADDDLVRVNCSKAGEIMHVQCGLCVEHKKPRHMCGCMAAIKAPTFKEPGQFHDSLIPNPLPNFDALFTAKKS